MTANGWPVYPETKDSDKRMPALAGGARIKPVKEEHLDRRPATPEAIASWEVTSSTFAQNTALLTGDGIALDGYGIFALDCDILDPVTSARILEIADEVLGVSPFQRVGNAPKFANLYRRPTGKLSIPRKNLVLTQRHNGKPQAIEIKDGAALTVWGSHATTGVTFQWPRGASPLTHRPDDAPVVTEALLQEFLRRVHAEFTLEKFDDGLRTEFADDAQYADTDVSEMRTPRVKDGFLPAEGVKITHFRKRDFLVPRAGAWAVFNSGIVAPLNGTVRSVSAAGCRAVAVAMAAEAREYVALGCQDRDDLTERTLVRVIQEMVGTAAAKIADGRFKPVGTQRIVTDEDTGKKKVISARQHVIQSDSEFSFLPEPAKRAKIQKLSMSEPDPELAKTLALSADRDAEMERVSAQVEFAMRAWLMSVATFDPEGKALLPSVLLKAPTGAGKTTSLIKAIGWLKRTHPHLRLGPILLLLPSYANAAEIESREDLGVWTQATEDRALEIIEEADGFGVRVMTFRGKVAGGCEFKDKVTALQKAGISSSGLCYSKKTEKTIGGEPEVVEKWCRFHPDNPESGDVPICEVIMQQRRIRAHDLILAPHAFIGTNAPKALREGVAAVVIDEKIWDKTLGNFVLPFDVLDIVREAPNATKKERQSNKDFDTGEYVEARRGLVAIVKPAFLRGDDVGQVLLDYRETFPDGRSKTGRDYLNDTLAVTGRGQRIGLDVDPDIDMATVTEMATAPRTESLSEEHRFWKVIESRMDNLEDGTARGETDSRLQLLTDGEGKHARYSIAVRWRKQRNFDDKPTLFLDASGDKKTLDKIWGRDVEEVVVEASQHVRTIWVPNHTLSKSGVMPQGDDEVDKLSYKAMLRTKMRDALYSVSSAFGFGGVVAASAAVIRSHLNDAWAGPQNMDWMHYGATRGLDWAKNHSALIAFGSLDLSFRDRDDYVAALSYDDDEPEAMTDRFGTGCSDTGKPLKPGVTTARHLCRDGSVAKLEGVPGVVARDTWAWTIQRQVREEELAQFIGRLRTVYRTGRAPVAIICGKILPEGTIVDEIVPFEDLARPTGRTVRPMETARQSRNIVARHGMDSVVHTATDAAVEKLVTAFETNPRLAEGWHEISYRLEGSADEHRAWAFAGDTRDAVERFRLQVEGLGVRDIRLTRKVRMVPFARPPAVHAIDEALGTRRERAVAEQAAYVQLFQRMEWKQVNWDETNKVFRAGGFSMDAASLLTYEQMTGKTAVEKPAEVEEPVDVAPITVSFKGDAPLPAPANDPTGEGKPELPSNVVRFEPRQVRRGFGSIRSAAAESSA